MTGRFQPFHVAHLELVMHAATLAPRVMVGVTNPDDRSLRPAGSSPHRHRSEANPFTFVARLRMIEAALRCAGVARDRYDVVPFPIETPDVCPSYIPPGTPQVVRVYAQWERDKAALLRTAGYPVLELPGDVASRIAASDVRAAMATGRPWRHLLPEGVAEVLDELGERAYVRRSETVGVPG